MNLYHKPYSPPQPYSLIMFFSLLSFFSIQICLIYFIILFKLQPFIYYYFNFFYLFIIFLFNSTLYFFFLIFKIKNFYYLGCPCLKPRMQTLGSIRCFMASLRRLGFVLMTIAYTNFILAYACLCRKFLFVVCLLILFSF